MLQTKIGSTNLKTCIYNASGPHCTHHYDLQNLNDNKYTSLVLTKSCTLNYREGNPEPRYYQTHDQSCSINSTGLANLGYQEYIKYSNHLNDKPYFISVSGLSLDDNVKIVNEIGQSDKVDGIELNLSCPNVVGKPQVGYDFETVDLTLNKIFESYDNQKQVFGIKLPPYFDLIHYELIAEIINKYPRIQFLTCINSLGNGLIVDPVNESVVIRPKNGFGGIGGQIIKPIALANVNQFYKLLGHKLDIIGCGGIYAGVDAFEHILCGAKAVQVGTKYMMDGIKCFEQISRELEGIMVEKGYKKLAEFRGRIKDC